MCLFPGGALLPEFLRSTLLAPPLCSGLDVVVEVVVVVDVVDDVGDDVVVVVVAPFAAAGVSCVVGVEFRRDDEKNPTFEKLRRTPNVFAECRRSKIPNPRFSGFSSDMVPVQSDFRKCSVIADSGFVNRLPGPGVEPRSFYSCYTLLPHGSASDHLATALPNMNNSVY